MPWKECNPMDEKLKFVARFLDGEKITALCHLAGELYALRYRLL